MICLSDSNSTSKVYILCIHEIKLNTNFTESHFKIDGYQFLLFRKDLDWKDGENIVFVCEGIVIKSLPHCKKYEL